MQNNPPSTKEANSNGISEHERILTRVGCGLIVVGCIDILFLALSFIKNFSYPSKFNITFIICGLLLCKGKLIIAHLVTWVSAFVTVGIVGRLVMALYDYPLDYLVNCLILNEIQSFFLLNDILSAVVFVWLYKTLSHDDITNAIKKNVIGVDKFWKKPRTAMIFSFCFFVSFLLYDIVSVDKYKKWAEIEAIVRYGDKYKYVTTSINKVNNQINAIVTAYNTNEIVEIPISYKIINYE